MRPDPLVPSFYFYKFAQAVSGPYSDLDAFRAGTIDAAGNIIKPESSIDPFEYFVIKLKRIFEQLPPGMTKSSLSSYIPTLQMFSEEIEPYGISNEELTFFIEGVVASNSEGEASYIELMEDMGSANLGGPATSAGYNTGGVSGHDVPMQKGIMKRKSILGFENSCEMFDVCPEEYKSFKESDAWRFIPDSDTKRYLQRYQRRNPSGKMAVRNSDTGEIHWLKLKPRGLIESFEESMFKIFNENYSDAAKELAHQTSQRILSPEEGHELSPTSGEWKRGAKTQRALLMFSALGDVQKGGKKHQEKTLETIAPFVKQEVSHGDKHKADTMVYDAKTGLFVPADLKGDTTTPFGHLSDEDIERIPGLSPLTKTIKDAIKRGTLSKSQKAEFRKAGEEIGKRSPKELRKAFERSILGGVKDLHWVIGPSKSDKPYLYPGLITTVKPEDVESYAELNPPSLSMRPSKGRVEWKARGREPSVEKVAKALSSKGVSTQPGIVLGALESLLSSKDFRRLKQQLSPNLSRVR